MDLPTRALLCLCGKPLGHDGGHYVPIGEAQRVLGVQRAADQLVTHSSWDFSRGCVEA